MHTKRRSTILSPFRISGAGNSRPYSMGALTKLRGKISNRVQNWIANRRSILTRTSPRSYKSIDIMNQSTLPTAVPPALPEWQQCQSNKGKKPPLPAQLIYIRLFFEMIYKEPAPQYPQNHPSNLETPIFRSSGLPLECEPFSWRIPMRAP